jgi:hypothetical protein
LLKIRRRRVSGRSPIEAILGWTNKSIYLFDLAFDAILGCIIFAGGTCLVSLLLFDWGSKPLALLVIGVGIYGGIWAALDRRKALNQDISQG